MLIVVLVVTGKQLASIASKTLGRRIDYVASTADDTRRVLKFQGMADWMIEGVVNLFEMVRHGELDTSTGQFFEQTTGDRTTSLGDFFLRYFGTLYGFKYIYCRLL